MTVRPMKALKNFDVFPKAVNSDLAVRTNAGGLLSLISFIVVCYCVVSELMQWSVIRPRTSMVLNNGRLPSVLPIALDILVTNNCSDLHLEYTNVKRTLELEGQIDRQFTQENEICHIIASFHVSNIPASFHIGLGESFFGNSGEHQHLWYTLENRNLSHQINRLSFGELEMSSHVDGFSLTLVKAIPYMITYSLQLVTVREGPKVGYQIIASLVKTNLEKMRSKGVTGIVFEWNFSPIGLEYSKEREPVIGLISRILAILGCLLMLARLLDSLVFRIQNCGV
jgi:hypothetical protein